ncbi:hypothetical protein D3C78_1977220 [compost metagenome]
MAGLAAAPCRRTPLTSFSTAVEPASRPSFAAADAWAACLAAVAVAPAAFWAW